MLFDPQKLFLKIFVQLFFINFGVQCRSFELVQCLILLVNAVALCGF